MNWLQFKAEIQNAKNIHPDKPRPCELRAADVIARYVDEREGQIWELLVSYFGGLSVRRGRLEGNPNDVRAIVWSTDVEAINK